MGTFFTWCVNLGRFLALIPGGWGNGSSKMCSGGILILISSQSFCSLCVIVQMILWYCCNCLHASLTHTLCLRFNGHFPGEPGLAGVYWSKEWWRWWWQLDYWSYKLWKAPVKSLPPTNQHPVFLQAGRPSCRSTNSVEELKGKLSHSMDLLTPSSPGGLPTLSLTTNSCWLPWGGLPYASRQPSDASTHCQYKIQKRGLWYQTGRPFIRGAGAYK